MKKYFIALLNLLFPRICLACGKTLYPHEEFVCNQCWTSLPRTGFHLDKENPVSRTFWGRVWIADAAACYYYTRGNRVQKLIHQLKYKGEEELGAFLGEQYAYELLKDGFLQDADLLIPVPLHPKKQKKRGYNQSEAIARGISRIMGIEVDRESLCRIKSTSTQTRKSRYHRWENVENIFQITNTEKLHGKHVVVIDDVITTGSTLEACITALQEISDIKVSVLALAYSSK